MYKEDLELYKPKVLICCVVFSWVWMKTPETYFVNSMLHHPSD